MPEPLYTYLLKIWFGWVGFYGISTIVGYLMPNPLYTYLLKIYDLVGLSFMAYQPLLVIECQIIFIHIHWKYMIWLGWILLHCRLSNAKSSLYIFIKKNIWFGWVRFYGLSTIVGYLMPNPLYTYILYIYIYIYIYMVWIGFMAY